MSDHNLSQTSQWDHSPNIGRDLNDNRKFILNLGDNTTKSPSIIAEIIQSLVPYIWSSELQDTPLTNEYKIIQKIDRNWLIKYRKVILELWKYVFSIENEFDNLEQKQPWLKTRFLSYINNEYKKTINSWYSADQIFDTMIALLKVKYNESSNNDGTVYLEDLEDAAQYIIGRSFIQCKVLEAPVQ